MRECVSERSCAERDRRVGSRAVGKLLHLIHALTRLYFAPSVLEVTLVIFLSSTNQGVADIYVKRFTPENEAISVKQYARYW